MDTMILARREYWTECYQNARRAGATENEAIDYATQSASDYSCPSWAQPEIEYHTDAAW